MPEQGEVRGHYTHGRLLDAIRDEPERLGKSPADATVDDLAPVDEFHIGGHVRGPVEILAPCLVAFQGQQR